MKLMKHLLSNFMNRPSFCIHQDIGLKVEWFAFSQQPLNFVEGVSFPQQWAMRLIPHSLPNCFRRSPQANHKRMLLEKRKIRGIGPQSSASGDHSASLMAEVNHDLAFVFSKRTFALLGEDLGDPLVGARFD
jgi:hypothetical protein